MKFNEELKDLFGVATQNYTLYPSKDSNLKLKIK